MGILSSIPVLGRVVDKGLDIVDQFVTDKDQAAKLKHQIKQQIEENSHEEDIAELKAQAGIVKAEATGESPAQRNWRPHLMYFIMFLLGFNGVIAPLSNALFGLDLPMLEAWGSIPTPMWQLLMIGMGGYVGGRSGEKIIREWAKSKHGKK